jgi:hypothetical protein
MEMENRAQTQSMRAFQLGGGSGRISVAKTIDYASGEGQ